MTEILSQLPESFPVLAILGVALLLGLIAYALIERSERRGNKE